MIEIFSKYTLLLFGAFFIVAGIIMFLKPETVRNTIRKAGSTRFINFAELLTRMIPGFAFVLYAPYFHYPIIFKMIGYFVIFSSITILLIPRKIHHGFSNQCAEILKPTYLKFISPISILIGITLILSIA